MLPIVNILGRELGMYPLMVLVGILVAGTFAYVKAEKWQIRPVDMIEVLAISAIGVVVGSHMLYALVEFPRWPYQSIWTTLGGSVFYGGLLGGTGLGLWYIRWRKYPLRPMTEIAACVIPLFHGFARIGCFFGGCCYGIESHFGFVMTESLAPMANGVMRFPVQLLEAAADFTLFLFLFFLLEKRQKLQNRVLEKGEKAQSVGLPLPAIYFPCYALIRFLDEFLRGDGYRGIWGPFSTSQWISLGILLVSGCYLMFRRKQVTMPENSKEFY